MKLMIFSDAWTPQINGVVTTLKETIKHLEQLEWNVDTVNPTLFKSFPCPIYKEINLALVTVERIKSMIIERNPNYIHIATEGPIGLAAVLACKELNLKFTTSYHTKFPEYLKSHFGMPLMASYLFVRWFHNSAAKIMTRTPSMKSLLESRGFKNVEVWNGAVNTNIFRPIGSKTNYKKPILTYVGRVSKEKNIEAFLNIQNNGTNVVVGDGPQLNALKKQYPKAVFLGKKSGEELVQAYNNADCVVFPSKTDTFGLTIIEALACGVPVAAYKVTGPMDILENKNGAGSINENLLTAVQEVLTHGNKNRARELSLKYSWENSTAQFISYLVPVK